MSFIEAIILGIIQGLTEFLPVSSSGHIELGKEMLGVVVSDPLMFSVVVHAATALSTIVIFRKDIVEIIKGLLRFKWNDETRFTLFIVISMIPAAVVGLYFEDELDAFFTGNILLVGMMLLITGLLLFLADRAKNTTKKVGIVDSILIGIAQAIAILPGISRSGATISTSVLLGIDRSKAARFSFLMVVPLILGAALLDVKKFKEVSDLDEMKAEQRVEVIMTELEKDKIITAEETGVVKEALLLKEQRWDGAKMKIDNNAGQGAVGRESEMNKDFEESLKHKVSSEAKDQIMTHHLAKVRPLYKLGVGVLLGGFIAAFVTGLIACTWMISLVKRSKLSYFSYYCFAVGAASVVWSLL